MKKLVLHSTDILNQELMLEKDLHNLYRYKNNKVIKIIRYDIEKEKETILQKLESHKIHQVDQLNQHPSLLYPDAVLIDENGYRGYLMDEIKPTTFSYESDPKEIFDYFKAVENVMEFGHQEGIIFPDIFSMVISPTKKTTIKQHSWISMDGKLIIFPLEKVLIYQNITKKFVPIRDLK